jgi:hypothetical protein
LTVQEQPMAEAVRLPALRPDPEVIEAGTSLAPLPFKSKVLPVVGTALAWAGREILLRLADLILDRQTTLRRVENGTRGRDALFPGARSNGSRQRHRHRRRGGG